MSWRGLATLGTAVLACGVTGSVAAADVAANKSQCTVRDATKSIRVVVCPPGLDEKALRDAGKEACGVQLTCNAWIWDNPEKAPTYSPATDSDIQPTEAGNAIAVWANDSKGLMLIKRVPK